MKNTTLENKKQLPTTLPKNAVSKAASRLLRNDQSDAFEQQNQPTTTISDWKCISWNCYYCNESFGDFNSLQSHQKALHQKTTPSENYYRCNECNGHLLGYASFLNHIRRVHHESLKKCCDVCNEVLSDYKLLSIHRDKHLEVLSSNTPIIYHCNLCDEVHSAEKLLKHHIQQTHDLKTAQDSNLRCEKNDVKRSELLAKLKDEIVDEASNCEDEYNETQLVFQCGKCSQNFNSAIDLKNHMNIHFDDGAYKCHDCVFSFRTEEDRKYHMRAHTTKYAFTCRLCKKAFNRSFALKVHMRTHTGNVSCDCYVCDLKFNCISDLIAHLRSGEHKDRPFKCLKCSKDFKYKASFIKHKCHLPGERNFKCEKCQKLYSNKKSFKEHVQTHAGHSYKCEICTKEFINIKSFKNHQRKHAAGDGFECEICKKIFKMGRSLKNHMRLHIGKTSNECEICGKTYKKLPALKRHKKICSRNEVRCPQKENIKS